jgi:hypothetical protein
VSTVDSEIFVGREDDGISERFGHANEASIGEAHRYVRMFLDQLHDWLYVLRKREGNEQSAAAKQGAEITVPRCGGADMGKRHFWP